MSVKTGLVIEDPRTNFDLEKIMLFPIGGKNVNYLSQAFTGVVGSNPGSVSINISLANTQALIRTSHFHFYGSCTFNVWNNADIAGGCIGPGMIALSQNAFYKILSSIQLTLGSYSTQWQNISQTVDMINSVRRDARCDWGYLSGDAQVMDCAVNFVDLQGSSRDIFNTWQSSTAGGYVQSARTSRIRIKTNPAGVNNTATPCAIDFDLYVPVLIQPLYGNEEEKQAFVRCNTINMTVNFASDCNNFISCNDRTKITAALGTSSAIPANWGTTNPATTGAGAAAGSLAFANNTKLDWCYQTVDISEIPGGVPLQCYNTAQWVYQSQPQRGLVAGMNAVTIQQFSFSTQPSLIMVGLVPNTAYTNGNSCPTWYAPPTGAITLNYIESNVLNIPAGMPKITYDICLKNGIDMDFSQWSADRITDGASVGAFGADSGFPFGKTAAAVNNIINVTRLGGGFLVLKPTDLRSAKTADMSAGSVASMSSGLTFSGSVGFDCPVAGDYQLLLIACYPKLLREVSFGNFVEENITAAGLELHKLVDSQANVSRLLRESELYGAGFFSFIKDAAKKVGHAFTKGYDFVKKHAGDIEKGLEQVLPVLESEIPFVGGPLSAATRFALNHKDTIAKVASAIKKASGSGIDLNSDIIGEMLGSGLTEDDIQELVTEVGKNPDKYLKDSEVSREKLSETGLSRFLNMRKNRV